MDLAQKKIKAAIKQMLKKQDRTYADLAKVWNCSVPTVKRQLGQEEMPLSRLLTLLEWLGLTLSDLHKLADSDNVMAPRYTAKQNEFLAKNPREFSFLMKLYEELTPEHIAQKYKLSPSTLQKILIQLEKHDLIRVGAGGRVKPFYAKMPSVDGPLAEMHIQRIIDRMAAFQKSRISDLLAKQARGLEVPKGGLSWNVNDISEKTYLQFVLKFNQLMEDLVSASRLEEKSMKKSELKVAVAGFGLFLCEKGDPNLHLAKEIMDDGLRA